MNIPEHKLVVEEGKSKTWRIEIVDENTGNAVGTRYEVRKGDAVLEKFDDERKAIEEMLHQDRLEVQNRPSGPGM